MDRYMDDTLSAKFAFDLSTSMLKLSDRTQEATKRDSEASDGPLNPSGASLDEYPA